MAPARLLGLTVSDKVSTITLYSRGAISNIPRFLRTTGNGTVRTITKYRVAARCGKVRLRILKLFVPGSGFGTIGSFYRTLGLEGGRTGGGLIRSLGGTNCRVSCRGLIARGMGKRVGHTRITHILIRGKCYRDVPRTFGALLGRNKRFCGSPGERSAVRAVEFLGSVNTIPIVTRPFCDAASRGLDSF